MKKLLTIIAMLPVMGIAQGYIDAGLGLSTRFGITAKIDAGYISYNRNLNGPMIAATTIIEGGFGANYGLISGWQSYGIALYVGASKWAFKNERLMEPNKVFPIVGIAYRWPENRVNADLRYQANSIYLTLNVRIGKFHNQ